MSAQKGFSKLVSPVIYIVHKNAWEVFSMQPYKCGGIDDNDCVILVVDDSDDDNDDYYSDNINVNYDGNNNHNRNELIKIF